MKSQNKKVAEKIIDILRNGLTINADTQHYIDSTFSNPSALELEKLLQDQSNCETDSLMALLFFPDESIQLQLEEIIEDTHFQKQDGGEIKDRVCSAALQTQFRFADGRGTMKIQVEPTHAAQFIERLNLSRSLDAKIKTAVARYVDPGLQTSCKVKLRNTRPITSPQKISFLQAFFEKLRVEPDDFFDYLDFTLGFMDELEEESYIYQSLMARKRLYFRSLQQAKKIDIQLSRHNVETILLSGKRISCVDRTDARKKIQLIDRISRSVFGKTEFFDLMGADEQYIYLQGREDIDKLLRDLG